MKDNDENKKDLEIDELDDLDGCEIVTLYDEELQKDVDFEEVAAINYNDKLYVFLTPVEPNENIEEGEVIIMEVAEDEEGEETLLAVTDEKLLDEIFDEFQKEMDEQGDDCGDDCGCGHCHGCCEDDE
ncbi:MAG: DUF1292 domain-containing protein [Clostridiales bacterium]|jgi:hypothetical protein|nr:DUF1292 domain-containing protein [Clostridiales bacterium]